MTMLLEMEPPTQQAAILPVGERPSLSSPLPDPSWVKGHCPACSAPLVDNEYYWGGVGFYTLRQCWNALQEPAACGVWDLAATFGIWPPRLATDRRAADMALEPIANSAARVAENVLKESVREVFRRHNDGQLTTQEAVEEVTSLAEKAGTIIAKRPMPVTGDAQ